MHQFRQVCGGQQETGSEAIRHNHEQRKPSKDGGEQSEPEFVCQ